ncbi:MAG: hypothetical protein EPN25_10100 [Nitrospirae bacterium]|nr:MAG: hypothetical protein EPN25_10100 [Nitrospirota bacterium]
MSKKMVALLVLLFSAPLIIYLLWPSDEKRIRKLFREGATAIEQKKTDEMMSKLSFNYTDEHGLSYLYLKEGSVRFFKQVGDIKVEYSIRGIDIKDTRALVHVEVRVIAGQGQERGYIAGDAAQPVKMKFHLEKERTTWLVVRTEGLPVWF